MVSNQKLKNSHGPMTNKHLRGAGNCVQCFRESNTRDIFLALWSLPPSRVDETDTDINKIQACWIHQQEQDNQGNMEPLLLEGSRECGLLPWRTEHEDMTLKGR